MHQSLTKFLLSDLSAHPDHKALLEIIEDLGQIGKEISGYTNKAGLVGILGSTGGTNVQDEDVQKLDVFANDLCKRIFSQSPHFIAYASEEEEEVVDISNGSQGQYVIAFDPLDGSSNIDVNVSIGTIFSVYKAIDGVDAADEKHFHQPGSAQVLAGYILYGSSTVLVFSFGEGKVHEFTLDTETVDFYLSNESIRIPEEAKYYSVNEANMRFAQQKDQDFVQKVKQQGLSGRYIGSLVADFHRNMLKGGVFLYPALDKNGTGTYKGKLRMNFELKPMAFLLAQAGGLAIDGQHDILEKETSCLHERSAVIMGNTDLVQQYY